MPIREFETGATRNSDAGKHDYEGFLCPFVLETFAQYMTKHRVMEDGSLRASDNWQKGIPQDQLMKSLLRHVIELWQLHRDPAAGSQDARIDAACAIMFNVQAYIRGLIR